MGGTPGGASHMRTVVQHAGLRVNRKLGRRRVGSSPGPFRILERFGWLGERFGHKRNELPQGIWGVVFGGLRLRAPPHTPCARVNESYLRYYPVATSPLTSAALGSNLILLDSNVSNRSIPGTP